MKKRNWGYLLVILVLAFFLYPLSFLEVKTEKGGQVVFLKKVSPGDQFEFQYIHSVDKTPVSGFFLITSKRTFQPIETHFLSYGPGLPSAEGKLNSGGGRIIAKPDVEEMERFSFFVSPFTHQSLIVKNERLDFSSFREGEIVTVTIQRYPLGGRILKHGRK